MKTVMAFGSFDHVHEGHRYYLSEAKKLGTLTVVVARDINIQKFKEFTPKYSETERVEHVKELGIADHVILGHEQDIYEVVEEVKPDIIAMGYDQRPADEVVEKELEKRGLSISIVRIKGYKEDQYKSSKLK